MPSKHVVILTNVGMYKSFYGPEFPLKRSRAYPWWGERKAPRQPLPPRLIDDMPVRWIDEVGDVSEEMFDRLLALARGITGGKSAFAGKLAEAERLYRESEHNFAPLLYYKGFKATPLEGPVNETVLESDLDYDKLRYTGQEWSRMAHNTINENKVTIQLACGCGMEIPVDFVNTRYKRRIKTVIARHYQKSPNQSSAVVSTQYMKIKAIPSCKEHYPTTEPPDPMLRQQANLEDIRAQQLRRPEIIIADALRDRTLSPLEAVECVNVIANKTRRE